MKNLLNLASVGYPVSLKSFCELNELLLKSGVTLVSNLKGYGLIDYSHPDFYQIATQVESGRATFKSFRIANHSDSAVYIKAHESDREYHVIPNKSVSRDFDLKEIGWSDGEILNSKDLWTAIIDKKLVITCVSTEVGDLGVQKIVKTEKVKKTDSLEDLLELELGNDNS